MNTSKFKFTLNLHRTQSQIALPVTRGDTARTLFISLADGALPYFIGNGCLAKLEILRPTGTRLEAFCPIENNAAIVYDFSQNGNTAAVEGIHDCAVILYDEDGHRIASPRFTMIVSDRVINSDDINLSDEDFTVVDAMLAEESKRQNAETARIRAESERADAESARQSNETARASAEAIRASTETARKENETKRISAEAERIASEEIRSTAEKARASAENVRNAAETDRLTEEAERRRTESARGTAEAVRSEKETERQTAEAKRAAAEALRAKAEIDREKFYAGLQANTPLPSVSSEDEGKLLRVSGGKWAVRSVTTIGECTVDLSVDEETYVTTVSVKDGNGNVLTSDSIDLPLESMVVGGSEENGIVTLTLKNGNTVTFDIGDLVHGLATKAEVQAAQAAANEAKTTASSHNQSASTITAGTFAGQVVANANGQAVGTSLLRNSKIVSAEENPTVNGEICWMYE